MGRSQSRDVPIGNVISDMTLPTMESEMTDTGFTTADTTATATDATNEPDALDAYASNHSLSTIEDIEGLWSIAGSINRDANATVTAHKTDGGPLHRAIMATVPLVTQGIVKVEEKAAGKKAADYKPTAVDRMVARFVSSGDTEVTMGTDAFRNMLATVQSILVYAAKLPAVAEETLEKALKMGREARVAKAADKANKPAVNGSVVIMHNIGKAAKKAKYERDVNDTEIEKAVLKNKKADKAFVTFVADWFKDKAAKHTGAADAGEGWDAIVTMVNDWIKEERTEETADSAAQTLATNAEALVMSGKAKVNKNTVTLELSDEDLAAFIAAKEKAKAKADA